jgi:hypothetical protein
MRRLAALLAVSAGLLTLPLATAPASACPQPQEGDSCCPSSYLVDTDVAGHPVQVRNPLLDWHPCE